MRSRFTRLAPGAIACYFSPALSQSGDVADFPTPIEAAGGPGVFVGRVRVEGNVIEYWRVADNLLKEAATNDIQITEAFGKHEGLANAPGPGHRSPGPFLRELL